MPRPSNKAELSHLSQKNYTDLVNFIHSLSETEQHKTFPEGTMNRNIRDILSHLHHWHIMFIEWYSVGMTGSVPEMPAKGYRWKDTPELNKWIWNYYQNTSLEAAEKMLHESFQTIQNIIAQHSNEELFEKKRYKWTGTTSLGSYLVSATSSHYDWALKLIKKGCNAGKV